MSTRQFAISLLLAMACGLQVSAHADEEASSTPAIEKASAPTSETNTQSSTTFGPVRPNEVPDTKRPLVSRFDEREAVHDSIVRLVKIRPTQARQDPEKFWPEYEIAGRPETLETIISLSVEEMPMSQVLVLLAEKAVTRFEVQPGTEKRLITVDIQEQPFPAALKEISKAADVVPIYDRFVDSYVLANLQPLQPVTEVEDFAIPLRHSDPEAFMKMARQLGFDPGEGDFTVNDEKNGFLYTGKVEAVREFRSLVRNLDRRPAPEGSRFTHEVIELKHQPPRAIILELWRTFPGNFGMAENKLAIITTPESLDAIRQRVAEYDQPAEQP